LYGRPFGLGGQTVHRANRDVDKNWVFLFGPHDSYCRLSGPGDHTEASPILWDSNVIQLLVPGG
jgi:hypothetical protein